LPATSKLPPTDSTFKKSRFARASSLSDIMTLSPTCLSNKCAVRRDESKQKVTYSGGQRLEMLQERNVCSPRRHRQTHITTCFLWLLQPQPISRTISAPIQLLPGKRGVYDATSSHLRLPSNSGRGIPKNS
jgi:hypothetical protein